MLGWYGELRFGAITYSNSQLVQVLKHPLTDSPVQDVIIDLRLPRTLAAILVGAVPFKVIAFSGVHIIFPSFSQPIVVISLFKIPIMKFVTRKAI